MTDTPAGAQLATTKNQIVDLVADKVRQFATNGQLNFPANYSPENALKSAWLILQETVDKDKRPVLSVCTTPSVANALLNMVVQGLNPAKKQGYFIAYGSVLVFQRSYFGTMAVAMRVDPNIEDITAQVVYAGDTFKYAIERGRKRVVEHVQDLANIEKAKAIAAYCTVYYRDGREISEVMTLDEIKQAWKQSQMRPVGDDGGIKAGSTHDKFQAEMMMKTVINRTCKRIVNASDDSDLVIKAFVASDQDTAEAIATEQISVNANTDEIIDVPVHVLADTPASEQPDVDWDAEAAARAAEGADGPGF
jgi:recombination protein RecT